MSQNYANNIIIVFIDNCYITPNASRNFVNKNAIEKKLMHKFVVKISIQHKSIY